MRFFYLFFSLLILSVKGFSQDIASSNGLQLKLTPGCSRVFWEGQQIHFSYTLKNMTNSPISFTGNIYPTIQKVIDLSSGEEIKYEKEIIYYSPPVKSSEIKESKVTLDPGYKEFISISLGYNNYGNKPMSSYISLDNTDKARTLPVFFKPGKYKVILDVTLKPYNALLQTSFIFEVKAAEGQIKTYLDAYLKALLSDLKSKDPNNLRLWAMAKSGDDNPYSIEAFRLLTIERMFGTSAIYKIRESPERIFEYYKLLPSFKKCESTYTAIWFIKMHIGKLGLLQNKGQVSDLYSFSDDYLKKVAHMQSGVSENFILLMKERYNVQNLKNYSNQE
jgi:hypothetical protein